MKFTTTVQQYDDSEDLYIEFPEEIIKDLGWKEGDTLYWDIKEDNTVVLSKVEDSSSTKEKHRHSDLDAIDKSFDKEGWYGAKREAIKEYIIDQSAEEVIEDINSAEKFLQDNYIQATNGDTYGDQGSKQSKDRSVSPPEHFPNFP